MTIAVTKGTITKHHAYNTKDGQIILSLSATNKNIYAVRLDPRWTLTLGDGTVVKAADTFDTPFSGLQAQDSGDFTCISLCRCPRSGIKNN